MNGARLVHSLTAALLVAAGLPIESTVQGAPIPAQSEITFVFKQMGAAVEGRFKRFDARVVLDAAKPVGGSVMLTMGTASATLGVADIDAELAKPEWLGAGKFPVASFESGRARALDATRYEVVGKLSIKGTVRELLVPVSLALACDAGFRHR